MTLKLEVAIGILTDEAGRLLVGRRMRSPQLGKWEMPGGKVEVNETVIEALKREFREEGNVELNDIARWTKIEDESSILYLYRVFTTDVFTPTIYEEYRYVEADELIALDWIEANRGFVPELKNLLKSRLPIVPFTYVTKNLVELLDCLNAISQEWNAREAFTQITCILRDDALLFPVDTRLSEKV